MEVNNVMINYVMQGKICVLQVKCWDVPVQWMICWRAPPCSWCIGCPQISSLPVQHFALRFGMDTKPKAAKQKTSVRPCPQSPDFLCMTVTSTICALTAWELSMPGEHWLSPKPLRFVASSSAWPCKTCDICGESGWTAVALNDHLLSVSRALTLSEPKVEEYPVDVPAISWADYMEYVDVLTKARPRKMITCWILAKTSMSEDEQENLWLTKCAAAASSNGHDDKSLFSEFPHAAEKLQFDLSSGSSESIMVFTIFSPYQRTQWSKKAFQCSQTLFMS